MDDLKTYQQVNKTDQTISFGISKMEDIYVKHNGQPDTPHRHNFFTVIITEVAQGKHFIDFNEYPLANNQLFFISPGQVHQLIEERKPKGYAMVFSNEFLAKNNIPIEFIDDLNLFHDFGESPPLILMPETLTKIRTYAAEIETTQKSTNQFKYEAIGALLKLILIECNNGCQLHSEPTQTVNHKNLVLSNFKQLINLNYASWHNTTEYAAALNITADYLNKLIKNQTGKTAKTHIQNRIIVAAKRRIFFTDLSSKEIGYELGFSEPANFSAFFKKCVGKSPTQFRQQS